MNKLTLLGLAVALGGGSSVYAFAEPSEDWYQHALPSGGVQFTKNAEPLEKEMAQSGEFSGLYWQYFPQFAADVSFDRLTLPSSSGDAEVNF